MTILITILHVIACLILILVILIQGGRGQGLTGPSFSSGNVQTLFGTKAGDFMTKATSVSAICFLLTCLSLDFIEAQKSRSLLDTRAAAPVDVDAIRKALAKVKAEAQTPEGAADAASKAVETTTGALDAAAKTAGQAASAVQEQTAGAVDTAQQAAAAQAPQPAASQPAAS